MVAASSLLLLFLLLFLLLLVVDSLHWCPWQLLNCGPFTVAWRCSFVEVRTCACGEDNKLPPPVFLNGATCRGQATRTIAYYDDPQAVRLHCNLSRCTRRLIFCPWSRWASTVASDRLPSSIAHGAGVMEMRTRYRCCLAADGRPVARRRCRNARYPEREFRPRKDVCQTLEKEPESPAIGGDGVIYFQVAIAVGLVILVVLVVAICCVVHRRAHVDTVPSRMETRTARSGMQAIAGVQRAKPTVRQNRCQTCPTPPPSYEQALRWMAESSRA